MVEVFSGSAEEYRLLGQNLESQGELPKAEQAFQKALKLTEETISRSGKPEDINNAKDLCLILADLNMQQGNMHGADVYYVKAMHYSKEEI